MNPVVAQLFEARVAVLVFIIVALILLLFLQSSYNKFMDRVKARDSVRLSFLHDNGYSLIRHPERGWAVISTIDKIMSHGTTAREAIDHARML